MDGWIWWSGVGRSPARIVAKRQGNLFRPSIEGASAPHMTSHPSHYWLISTNSYRIISMCEMGVRICHITSGHTFPTGQPIFLYLSELAISWSRRRRRIYLCNVWSIYFFDLRAIPFRRFMSSAAAYFPLIEMKLSPFIWLISRAAGKVSWERVCNVLSCHVSLFVYWPCTVLEKPRGINSIEEMKTKGKENELQEGRGVNVCRWQNKLCLSWFDCHSLHSYELREDDEVRTQQRSRQANLMFNVSSRMKLFLG